MSTSFTSSHRAHYSISSAVCQDKFCNLKRFLFRSTQTSNYKPPQALQNENCCLVGGSYPAPKKAPQQPPLTKFAFCIIRCLLKNPSWCWDFIVAQLYQPFQDQYAKRAIRYHRKFEVFIIPYPRFNLFFAHPSLCSLFHFNLFLSPSLLSSHLILIL